MRLVVALLLLVLVALPASAQTVWNVRVAARDGGATQLRTLDVNPDEALPRCRCVAGRWVLKDETATHFIGTLGELSFNHAREGAKATLRVKVRKTRAVMGVHRDYRDALLGALRRGGPLVLREVTGGEWEVAAFADAPVGDLFAKRWRSTAKRPARPLPLVDHRADAAALVKLINAYRASKRLRPVTVSRAMTKVAQAHARDLASAGPHGGRCNLHSWSKQGPWSACCYDHSAAAARCMWKKPREIAGYQGNGYEIAATASGITPARALELWKASPAHDAVMSNAGQWSKPWRALGVAIEGDYAVAWFGELPDR